MNSVIASSSGTPSPPMVPFFIRRLFSTVQSRYRGWPVAAGTLRPALLWAARFSEDLIRPVPSKRMAVFSHVIMGRRSGAPFEAEP
jgi:hypothetical protein